MLDRSNVLPAMLVKAVHREVLVVHPAVWVNRALVIMERALIVTKVSTVQVR